MPAELDEYNPDDTFMHFTKKLIETFDENGLKHSYDDKPAVVVINGNYTDSAREFYWLSHGKLHRANGKPPVINLFPFSGLNTCNVNGRLQSFNDKPSNIDLREKYSKLEWHANESLHRSDNPAQVFFYEERIDNKQWHHEWYLYGTRISEETFNEIKTFEQEKDAPLWVAFLHTLELIHYEEVALFLNELGKWDNLFPINWMLKTWNITDEKYNDKMKSLALNEGSPFVWRNLEVLRTIANFEEKSK
jgi:hypothetical protein